MSTAPQLLLGYSQRMRPKEVVEAWVEPLTEAMPIG
jgi:hypothetical protein